MNDLIISVDLNPSRSDIGLLSDGLSQHSFSFVREPGFVPIAVFARDTDGALVGGAYGFLNWAWLNVRLLWVGEGCRGQGLGSKLLSRIETEAEERGCTNAHLDTLGFQAFSFYKKHGYETFGELPGYPGEHRRTFLKKKL